MGLTQTTEQERAEFEVWARDRYPSIDLTRDGDDYSKALAKDYWSLWQAARRAPVVPQSAPVAYLWQHGETGRTRIVMPDTVITADANWIVVGPLYLAAAPQPPEAACNPSMQPELATNAAPVQMPEPQAEIEVRSMKTYLDLSIHEWSDTLPDGCYKIYTEQQVRQLLAAHGIGKDKA